MIYLGAPRPIFLCRSTREELERECIQLRTTHVTGYGRCEQLFTLFFRNQRKVDPKQSTVDPRGNPDAQSSHGLSRLHPPPGPWQRGCTPLTPTRGYTPVHITPITPENNNKNNSCQSSLLAATRPSNTHERGGCGCCCGLGVDTDAPDAIGGQWARL